MNNIPNIVKQLGLNINQEFSFTDISYAENSENIYMFTETNLVFKNGWRASRLVVLPDYQGLGIGKALLDMFAKKVVEEDGGKFFARMMNPALAIHCLNSPNYVETSHSRKKEDKAGGFKNYKHDTRLCYAFRYEQRA